MQDRVEAEVELLRREYDDVILSEDGRHVVVQDVSIPGAYNRDTTDVLIVVPDGYPDTPPDNFFVPSGLTLESRGHPDRTSQNARSHEGRQWDQFSWHVDGDDTWRPRADPEEGSNLLTWMHSIEERLEDGD